LTKLPTGKKALPNK
jgi:hypothetical protein